MEIKELKKAYEILAKKHGLPGFRELNENFEIDKIEKETDCLLRIVRKVMMEKIINSLNFLEMLLNPVNTPRLYANYARSMSSDDRKEIDKIYDALGKLSIASLDLEIDYSEKKEAETINNICKVWNSAKPGFRKILSSLKVPNGSAVSKKEKSYFG
jgi:hypothetical protein